MTETEETAHGTANIARALAAFQADMPTVAKGKKANVPTKTGGSYSYTYADLADVTQAAMPVLSKHGLSFACLPDDGRLTGILLHESGESLQGTLPLRGSTPQEIGSALTYARRYLLGCLTGLVTDDDEDGSLSQQAKERASRREPDDAAALPVTAKTRGQLFALFAQKGIAEEQQLAGINSICGMAYESRGQITEADARAVIAVLRTKPDAKAPAETGGADA